MPKQVAVRQYSIATIHFDGLLLPMSLSSAVWAAVSTASISNSSQPLMTVMAYPPDFPVGPRRSISSSQASVPRRVPFIGKNWIQGLKAVVFRCSFPRAVWAAPSTTSTSYSSRPLMTSHTSPPGFLFGSRRDIFSSQAAVPRRVPFIGKNWIDGLQAIVLRCGSSGAVRAAIPSVPATYGGLPLVTLTTSPPDLLVRT